MRVRFAITVSLILMATLSGAQSFVQPVVGNFDQVKAVTPTLVGYPGFINDCLTIDCDGGGGSFECLVLWTSGSAWEAVVCTAAEGPATNLTDGNATLLTDGNGTQLTDGGS